tara:strand:- start:45 stop:263 length:219 start_codon:yes stop_codon:yes gene_type:complete
MNKAIDLKYKLDVKTKQAIKSLNIVLDDALKHNENILNCNVNIEHLLTNAKEIVFICENMKSVRKLEERYEK